MNALRIFAHAPRRRSLVRPGKPQPPPLVVVVATADEEISAPAIVEPTPAVVEVGVEVGVEVEVEVEPIELVATAIEQTISDVLANGPELGETIDAAYRRKERDLASVFGSLTRVEAAILLRRFSEARAEDALAQRFSRLVVDRRTRLLGVLADIPRREARRR